MGENLPVAPVDPITDETAVGRNSGGIGINPADPDHIVAFTWEAYADPGETCEYHVSRDGGETWTTGVFPTPEGFNTEGPGNLGYCSTDRGGDRNGSHGHMEFGTGDTVYTAFVAIKEGRLGNSLMVARSDDGGETWDDPVEAIEGGTNEFLDAPHMFFARLAVEPGGGEGGADRIYVHGRNSPLGQPLAVTMAVSDDGGETWSEPTDVNLAEAEPGDPSEGIQGFLASEVVIGPDGDAFVAWRSVGRPDGFVRIGRTSDGGETWSVHDVVPVRAFVGPGDAAQTTSAYPRLAVDDNTGALYLVYHQDPPTPDVEVGDVQAADHWYDPDAGVYLVKSTDDGETWSDPLKVNDDLPADSGNVYHQTRHPNVNVSPSGRVDVAWMDRRHWIEGRQSITEGGQDRHQFNYDDVCTHSHAACTEARTSDIYYAFSTDGGDSFSTDKRVTDYSSNNEVGWEYNIGPFWWHGLDLDYAAGDDLVVAWSDSRRGRARSGGVTVGSIGPENNDLFMATISHDVDAAPRVRSLPADNAADLSATMSSEVGYMGGVQGRLTGNRITSPFSQAVVVNEDDWASALVGSVLARRYMGPVLATPAGGLPAAVSAEIDRMELFKHEQAPTDITGVDTSDMVHTPLGGAFILGDTGDVGAAVQTDLEGRDIDVTRFDQDPAEMAAQVARHLDDRFDHEADPTDPAFVPAFDAVIVVNPNDPDSAAASVLAASRRLPVLFVESDTIPAATQSALDDLDIDQTLVVGDTDAVDATVFDALPGAQRVSGTDAFDTSEALAHESRHRGLPANVVYVVGDDPVHAALAGSPVARAGGLLLQEPDAAADAAMDTMADLGLDEHVDKVVRFGDDLEAPVWPDGASLTSSAITQTGVTLSWDEASDDTDVAGYRVFQDGTEIADQSGTSLTVSGLSPDTAYTFTVEAYDAAGNESEDGPSVSVTTLEEGVDPEGGACDDELVPASPFTDIAGNVHADNIACIVWYGLTQGTTPTTYSPTMPVTRDQMASFIARLMEQAGVTFEAASDQGFTDIAGNVHAERINQLAAADVVLGTSATTYAPRQEVRRDQMASFLVRAYEVINEAELDRQATAFTDVAGNTHLENIEKAATAGFAQGTTTTTYAPAASVRRDQMGSFLARVLERGMTDGHVTHPAG